MTRITNRAQSSSAAQPSTGAKLLFGFIVGAVTVLLALVLGLIPAIAIGGIGMGVVARIYIKAVSRD
jgi:F0F1-type ATP synthase membrane subunit c/vacuolar-type H+-ATPase subunit K